VLRGVPALLVRLRLPALLAVRLLLPHLQLQRRVLRPALLPVPMMHGVAYHARVLHAALGDIDRCCYL
jgi:hypothetical protein